MQPAGVRSGMSSTIQTVAHRSSQNLIMDRRPTNKQCSWHYPTPAVPALDSPLPGMRTPSSSQRFSPSTPRSFEPDSPFAIAARRSPFAPSPGALSRTSEPIGGGWQRQERPPTGTGKWWSP